MLIKIASTTRHIYYLTKEGLVYEESISDGSSILLNIEHIVDIACGRNHTLFLSLNGAVYGLGSNITGELIVLNHTLNTPVILPLDERIVSIKANAYTSNFITVDGKYITRGEGVINRHLDILSIPANIVDNIMLRNEIVFATDNGDVYEYTFSSKKYTELPLQNIYHISIANNIIYFLSTDGVVYTCKDIAIGIYFVYRINAVKIVHTSDDSYILTSNGRIYSINYDSYIRSMTKAIDISTSLKCLDTEGNIFSI